MDNEINLKNYLKSLVDGIENKYNELIRNNPGAAIKKYGSIDKMLLVEYGIDNKVKKQIKKKYLVK